jgi:hypothetical protein
MWVASGIAHPPIAVVTRLDEEQVAAIDLLGKPACQEIAIHLAGQFLAADEISEEMRLRFTPSSVHGALATRRAVDSQYARCPSRRQVAASHALRSTMARI